jgi:hypothetical protein
MNDREQQPRATFGELFLSFGNICMWTIFICVIGLALVICAEFVYETNWAEFWNDLFPRK